MAKSKNDPSRGGDAAKQDQTQDAPTPKTGPETISDTTGADTSGSRPTAETSTADAPADTYGVSPVDEGTHPAAESPDSHSDSGPPGDVGADSPADEYGITPAEGWDSETVADRTAVYSQAGTDDARTARHDSSAAADDTLAATDDTPLATAGTDSLPLEATPAAALGDSGPVRETVVERRGGFLPMVLGGIIAAALGFAAAHFGEGRLPFMPAPEPDPFVAETENRLTQQDERVAELEARLQELQGALGGIDVDSVSGAVDALVQRIDTLAEGRQTLIERLDTLESRMNDLEKQPLEQAVSPEAIAAYERELATLRDSLEAQRASVEQSRAEIEAIAQTARQSEQSAAQQAQLAEQRVALAELTAALQAGQPYEDPLRKLLESGAAVPSVLTQADEEGIPSPAQLVAEYPDAARDALRAARLEEDTSGGVAAFLRTQLGARSVTPQLGDDADAILSRAEAAVQRGNLQQALDNIAALPEPAQAEMADWVAMARARVEALDAVSVLAGELNE